MNLEMTIDNLKSSYPFVKFIPLKQGAGRNVAVLENIDDLFSLSQIIGYVIEEESAELVSETNWETIKDLFFTNFVLGDPYYHEFLEFLDNEENKYIQRLCCAGPNRTVILYSLEKPICYKNELEQPDIDVCKIIDELKKVYESFQKTKEQEVKERNAAIYTTIDRYTSEYAHAISKTAKDKIIRKIQAELKQKFALDGRGNTVLRANKYALEIYLDDLSRNNLRADYKY